MVNSWITLPLMKCYYSSKKLNFKSKLVESVAKNLFLFIVIVLLSISAIYYLNMKTGKTELLPVFISLSNSFGMILLIVFLGYGLVSFPRDCLNNVVNLKSK